ncbi:MAG: TonB-dependent receptor [Bacteroidota bacterium]
MLKKVLFGLFCCFLAQGILAQDQIDTSILLKEVNINSYRFNQFTDGNKQQKIDSLLKASYFAASLAEALNGLTTLYLKSYGISGNTGISLRGTGSAHTAVLWNGINLQDPLNGLANLELISLQAIDNVNLQYGGSGALFGSGAIGGAVILQSQAKFETGLKAKLSSGFGSFNSYFGQTSVEWGGKNLATSWHFFYNQAQNDFPFENTQQFGHPKIRQSNAALKYFGTNQDNQFRLADNQKINTHLWVQKTERELPPNMTMLLSKQKQTDEAIRFTADYSLVKTRFDFMVRFAFLNSRLIFNDSLNGIFAEHFSRSFLTEAEFNFKIRINHLLNFGIHNRIDWAKSESFLKNHKLNTLAFLLNYKYVNANKTLKISGSIRHEWIDNKFIQPNPSLGLNYEITKNISLSSKVSRNYRKPTFNDLYWQDGFSRGNSGLLPETSWAEDLAFLYQGQLNKSSFKLSVTAFSIYVKNLIHWIPLEGIWTPLNQKEVWSRGIETDFSFQHPINAGNIKFDFHHVINPSTLKKVAENESEANLNKQLIYTPKHQLKAVFRYQNLHGCISAEQIFVGKRFTISDNSSELAPYHLTNIIIFRNFKMNVQHLGISFRLNNLFNQAYQSMENYALPGRNYQFNIQFKIN